MAIYSAIRIQSSVGKNGKNNPVDVKTVQIRLNELIRSPRKKLTEDGKIGPKTIGMIRDFQETVLNFHRPDSLVDPNGKSHRALNDPASESKWARKSSETKLDVPRLSATQKGTSSKEFTIWFVSDHYDGFKIGASIKNMTQSQIVSVLFRNSTLPKDVYVTLDPPHVWSIAFGGSYFDITKGWGKSYNPGLVLVKEKYYFWVQTKRILFETKGYLNRETERKADIYNKNMSVKFRRLVAQEITATGYSIGELSNMGVGAYETDEHFITVLNFAMTNNSDYSNGGRSRYVSVVRKKKMIEKQIRWWIERGIDVKFAELVNSEQGELLNVSIIAGMTGTTAPAAQMIVMESTQAQRVARLIERAERNPYKKIKKIPSKTR